jgi:ribosomal protein S3AE
MAQKSAEKWKNKLWFNVYPPVLLGEAPIGEIPADDEKNLVGRVMKVSMSWITHKPEHSFMIVGLRIIKVNGNTANTDFRFMEQTFSYIHSLVKRHSSAIYTVDKLTDKNGKKFVLKLLAVTTTKIRTPKKTAIRKAIGTLANEYASTHTVDEMITAILDNTLRGEAVKRVTNIAPLSKFELKKIEV